MRQAISIVISLGLSACLYFGWGALQEFAYYVISFFVLATLFLVFFGGLSSRTKESVRAYWKSDVMTEAVSIAALTATGHSGMAALSFISAFCITGVAFADCRKEFG